MNTFDALFAVLVKCFALVTGFVVGTFLYHSGDLSLDQVENLYWATAGVLSYAVGDFFLRRDILDKLDRLKSKLEKDR